MSQQQVFSDRYEMVSHIARGGMAQVYLARDLLLDRPVALKVLFPELSVDRSFVERFRREAKAAANLTHPNIVSIFDWGQGEHTYFIVMEFVDGLTLSALLRQGPIEAARACAIGADVAAALEFAHRRGVIHRDVKPGNVLIDNNGQVKVADFGIAQAAGSDGSLTQTGSVMGTATYFSPEQAQGLAVDARSDVYSLGVVLYEMATGKPPFAGDNPVSIAYKHVKEVAPSPSQINRDVPANFEAIVMKAMAKDPAERYQSAEELRADLVRFRDGQPVAAAAAATRVVSAVGVPTGSSAAADVTRVQAASGTTVLPVTSGGGGPGGPGWSGDGGSNGRGGGGDDRRSRAGMYSALAVLLVLLAAGGYLGGRAAGWFGSSTKTLTIPSDLINKPSAAAQSELQQRGFTNVTTKLESSSQVQIGNVISTAPPAGTTLRSNQPVVLSVSDGLAPVKVPDVVGKSENAATQMLSAEGFIANVTTQTSNTVATGYVISTSPAGNQSAGQGSAVQVFVSSGKQLQTIPSLVGQGPTVASQELEALQLKVAFAPESSPTIQAGDVTRTNPPANSQVAVGSTVTIYVSTGPPLVAVPNVVGKNQNAATQELQQAGFSVTISSTPEPVSDPNQDGKVQSESPQAGMQAAQGSTVTLVIGTYQPGGGTTTTTSTTT
jgi:beta-lactam-binding protein with PASTA domain